MLHIWALPKHAGTATGIAADDTNVCANDPAAAGDATTTADGAGASTTTAPRITANTTANTTTATTLCPSVWVGGGGLSWWLLYITSTSVAHQVV